MHELKSHTTSYALLKDGRQVSKAHSSRDAVFVEAIEKGAVWQTGRGDFMANGYEVRDV